MQNSVKRIFQIGKIAWKRLFKAASLFFAALLAFQAVAPGLAEAHGEKRSQNARQAIHASSHSFKSEKKEKWHGVLAKSDRNEWNRDGDRKGRNGKGNDHGWHGKGSHGNGNRGNRGNGNNDNGNGNWNDDGSESDDGTVSEEVDDGSDTDTQTGSTGSGVSGTGSSGTGTTGGGDIDLDDIFTETGSTNTGSVGGGNGGASTGSTSTGSDSGTGSTGTGTNTGTGDSDAPTVSITSPANASSFSGSVRIEFSAADIVWVSFVHYSVSNGTDDIAGQLTSSPYAVEIPASVLGSGTHTVTAYAQDAAGNIGNATPISFGTTNAPEPTVPQVSNLVQNGSFETSASGLPEHWFRGSWGTNDTVFAYPVAGIDGNSAVQITMNGRTDGDAKWYFDSVAVTPGQVYTYSDRYKSTVPTAVTVQFTNASGAVSFLDLSLNVPASADWSTVAHAFAVPAGASRLTVYHVINSVGTLTVDDVRLVATGGTAGSFTGSTSSGSFASGLVSLSFDDGWGSHYDNALPLLNAAGIKGTFYIISNEMKNAVNANRLDNPSFESTGSESDPIGWSRWQTGEGAAFAYPVAGFAGQKAAKVELTSNGSGEAAWKSAETTVVDGETHNFTDAYVATVPTKVGVTYVLNDGTSQSVDLGTVPAASNWAIASFTFRPPMNVATISVYHRLTSPGVLTVDDFHLDLAQDYMNQSQVQSVYAAGHEIGAHTRTHAFLTQIDPEQLTQEISGSRQDLISAGFGTVSTFAYTYGEYNDAVVEAARAAGFSGARTTDVGYNAKTGEKLRLMVQNVEKTTTPQQWEAWVQEAMANHAWLILTFHQIDHQDGEYGATPEDLQVFLSYLKANGVPTATVAQGLGMMQ